MKELLIFRTFAFFPFIGILVPDIATKLDSSLTPIPPEHLIIDITLAICIITCSLGIWAAEQAALKAPLLKSKTLVKTKRHIQLAGNLKKNLQVPSLKQMPYLAD
jgi:hypothetical protein